MLTPYGETQGPEAEDAAAPASLGRLSRTSSTTPQGTVLFPSGPERAGGGKPSGASKLWVPRVEDKASTCSVQ